MSKEIYISSTPHETRLAIVEKEELSEIYYERENEYTLAGSIYNGRVTRVLPGMQSAFVDIGLERDAFLYITDFLEEQGESAEFEGGEGRREARGERNGDRSGRREGRDRDRNGRGREQESRNTQSESPSPAPAVPEETEYAARSPIEQAAEEGEEGGEGSRRWRGRRGRRRGGRNAEGRGPVQGADAGTVVDEELASFTEVTAAEEPLEQIFGQAEPASRDAGRERGRDDRGGRDRGGRGRDRDRSGDRGKRLERGGERDQNAGQEQQAGAEPLILPGESLSRYRKGSESEAPAAEAAVSFKAKPSFLRTRPSTEIDLSAAAWDGGLMLPGESLSRARRTEEPPQAQAAPFSSSATGEEQTEETEGQDTRGSSRRRDRDRRRGRTGREDQAATPELQAGAKSENLEGTPGSFRSGAVARESLHPMEAVQPGISSGHEPEGTQSPTSESLLAAIGTSDDVPAFEIEAYEVVTEAEQTVADDVIYEPETDVVEPVGPTPELIEAVQAMHASLELEPAHAGEELEEETHEYEPGEDASASYRVDPAGPSEFRQSTVAGDDDVSEGDPEIQADYAGTDHQYTTIVDAGEMLSELPGAIAIPAASEDPTNPIEHETAVLSERASELLQDTPAAQLAEPTEKRGAEQGDALSFAPGDGPLEEELIDEDETELLDVAASYGDDTEEETYEAGAEIGSLARDRALDQITEIESAEAEDDDDFDIDEEEMEEDELDGAGEIAAADIAEAEEDDLLEGEDSGFDEETGKPAAATMGEFPEFAEERPARRNDESNGEGRREVHRGGERERGGRDRGGRDGRDRRGMANSRNGGRQSRHSMQNTDLPAISDLLKPGQEVLVQIAKEPIAKKGRPYHLAYRPARALPGVHADRQPRRRKPKDRVRRGASSLEGNPAQRERRSCRRLYRPYCRHGRKRRGTSQ